MERNKVNQQPPTRNCAKNAPYSSDFRSVLKREKVTAILSPQRKTDSVVKKGCLMAVQGVSKVRADREGSVICRFGGQQG